MRLEASLPVLENSRDDTLGSPFLAGLKNLLSLSETNRGLVRTLEDIELLVAEIFEADKCSIRLFGRTPAKTPQFGRAGGHLADFGVITIHGYRGSSWFTGMEKVMLEIVALMLGKSLRLMHIHNLLKLRYRHAVVRQCSPVELAILFYEDLQKAGFDSGAVVIAASEIIAQVSAQLRATTSV